MAFTTQYIYCSVIYYLSDCFRSKTYSKPCQTSRMGLFPKIVYGFRSLTIIVKSSILDIRLGSEYASTDSKPLLTFLKNEAADLLANQAPIGTFLNKIILILNDRHFP